MEFHHLRALVEDSALNQGIDELLALKSRSGERAEIDVVPALNDFIGRGIQACNEAVQAINARKAGPEALDVFFRSWLFRQRETGR